MLLDGQEGLEVVAECQDGLDTIEAVRRTKPDLVFLDVQMPGASGFDVVTALGGGPLPLFVFVTAFDKYALKAFDVHALDYLLKPFDRDRFLQALARARHQLERPSHGDLRRRLLALVRDLEPTPPRLERFVIRSGGRVFFVRADEIDWIEAAGNYVRLHVGADTHLFRETMNAVEAQLPPETFYRIHRCHIVNIERVKELQPWFNGEYVVFLRTGARLTLSRGYREKLQDRIGRPL
jgi:two-component system, LytTR family, response regulator